MLIVNTFLTLVGATLFYLCSKHQRYFSKPLESMPFRYTSIVIMLLSLFMWVNIFQPAAGVFTFFILITLCWGLLPHLSLLLISSDKTLHEK